MITARDIALPQFAPSVSAAAAAPAASLRERLLLMVLFATTLASAVAFIEPSPHDALMGLLALAGLIAGARFDRILLVPLLLLLLWNVAGLMALTGVLEQDKTVQYAGTSVYLALAALVFACLFSTNTMPRLAAMRSAYILAALASALAGAAGYFHLFPRAGDLFTLYDRAMGAFKDPNVYATYLIWPALFVIDRMVARQIRLRDIVIMAVLMLGLLLSFSRGAWFNFAVGALVVVALAFVTAHDVRERWRVVGLSAAALIALAVFVAFLLSFHSLSAMFDTRAQLIQSYDVGQGGRFRLQELAFGALLDNPGGMGPFEFARVHGLQQHNVYLQAFLVYGWAGGVAYLLLLCATVTVGLRTALARTPWQPYAITALAALIGDILEGFVIDTDHWRHFFLLLGIIWGTAAATMRARRRYCAAAGPSL
ncbi:MAG TPA: O-antigen ligase family protein [Pseudolabrys sp.]|nr:O-antigen ligase family protein [Pseudolabrys sp.]